MASKVVLVTGGSSGIGEATALKLHELGYTTYAAARRTQRMEHLTKAGIRPLAMDVTNDESMQSGVTHILGEPSAMRGPESGALLGREHLADSRTEQLAAGVAAQGAVGVVGGGEAALRVRGHDADGRGLDHRAQIALTAP